MFWRNLFLVFKNEWHSESVEDEGDTTCLNELSFRKHKAVLPVTRHTVIFLYLIAVAE